MMKQLSFFRSAAATLALALLATGNVFATAPGDTDPAPNSTGKTKVVKRASVGYMTGNGSFTRVDAKQLEAFFQQVEYVSERQGHLVKYDILQAKDAAGHTSYLLHARLRDGNSYVSTTWTLTKKGRRSFALASRSCSCSSSQESVWTSVATDPRGCACGSPLANDLSDAKKTSAESDTKYIEKLFLAAK